jgi:hypothetical protein
VPSETDRAPAITISNSRDRDSMIYPNQHTRRSPSLTYYQENVSTFRFVSPQKGGYGTPTTRQA